MSVVVSVIVREPRAWFVRLAELLRARQREADLSRELERCP